MKIGLFGGSFDPIHDGHIRPVREARRALGLERVIYLPTAVPPHKPGRQLAPAYARYAMVELALLDKEGLYASPHELTQDRPAYTIDTIEHFQAAMPAAEIHLLIGGDSFLDLPHWRRWHDIVAAARLIVLLRPGWDLDASSLSPDLAALARSDRVHLLRQTPVDVSATRLRALLACGEPIPDGAIPPRVVQYVHKYDLYR
jgi:nicotinate-nucleotide adenylyltransferase